MKTILLLLVSLCFVSCNGLVDKKQNGDSFYTDKGDFDMGRFPLIKPWEATVPSPGHNDWIVASIDTNDMPFTVLGSKQIRVVDSIIFIHAIETIINFQDAKEGWFIIIPKHHLAKAFTTHQAYASYVDSLKLKREPELYNPDNVFTYFDKHNYINWRKIQ